MEMKNNIKIFIILMMLSVGIVSCGESKKQTHEHHEQTFTCPMHPDVVKNEMDICPICHMDLVPVNKNGSKNNELMLSDDQIKLANIRTLKIEKDGYESTTQLKGVLKLNPLSTVIISNKFAGRIEQLYFKETGINIKAGQAIFSLYSEELLTLQKDYLLNIKQQEAFPNEAIYSKLTAAAKKKLLLYGYTNKQIQNLSSTKKLDPKITVLAEKGGVIKEINVNEGQYVAEGSPAFIVENLNTLWLEAEVYPNEVKNIKVGQTVKVSVNGYKSEPVNAKVDFISPQLQENSQVALIRASIPNPDQKYQAGMYANISLSDASKEDIIKLPVNAVVRDEMHHQIWIRTGNNTFEPRYVELGEENENAIVVTKGINSGDEIVISGAYLLYSEHKLKKGTL
jgi:Cu(I)/Ag(I) efflux system membrane fusion protein